MEGDQRSSADGAVAADMMQAMLDGIPALVSYWDVDLRNRFANRAYAAHYGVAAEALRGRHVREIVGEALFAQNEASMVAALAGQPQQFERTIEDASGLEHHTQVSYVPDRRDGRVCGLYVQIADITERKRAEHALLEERAFLRRVLDHLPNTAVFVFDEALRILRVLGTPTLASAGMSEADYIGRTISEFALPENRAALEAAGRATIDGHRARVEVERGGRRFEVNLIPMSGWTGAGKRGMAVSYDVTERDRLRAQLAAQERLVTIGTLAAGVGHEINNPLSYVMTNVEMISEELTSLAGSSGRFGELVTQLAEIRDGTERIRKIVRGLRSFARLESTPVPTDVVAALEVSVNMAMHELRSRATVVRDLPPVPLVLADEARLAQVFVNLLVNAAQAFGPRPAQSGHVFVSTRTDAQGRAVVVIRDDGPGMDAATAARIFDPFFTTKPPGQGTGLGLTICHNVVASLGGEIVCETAPGQGTTFRITLDAAPADSVGATPSAGPVVLAPRGHILVVDDDPALTASIERVLKSDHDVTSLNDPRAARDLLLGGATFDVVFCDIMMPDLSGPELYRSVRAQRPLTAARFVFVTGGMLDPKNRAFLEDVPNEHLEKPLGVKDLRSLVRRLVEAREDH
jgi:PAS domain S-box-containing protein